MPIAITPVSHKSSNWPRNLAPDRPVEAMSLATPPLNHAQNIAGPEIRTNRNRVNNSEMRIRGENLRLCKYNQVSIAMSGVATSKVMMVESIVTAGSLQAVLISLIQILHRFD